MHFTKALSSEMTSNYKCRKCLNIPWFALSVCNSSSVAKSSSVKNGNALWAEKEEKMLMFCSLALLVKIKLCGGNLCESVFFFFVVLLPSLQYCGDSCPTDLTAELLLPCLAVLQDETHARKRADLLVL